MDSLDLDYGVVLREEGEDLKRYIHHQKNEQLKEKYGHIGQTPQASSCSAAP